MKDHCGTVTRSMNFIVNCAKMDKTRVLLMSIWDLFFDVDKKFCDAYFDDFAPGSEISSMDFSVILFYINFWNNHEKIYDHIDFIIKLRYIEKILSLWHRDSYFKLTIFVVRFRLTWNWVNGNKKLYYCYNILLQYIIVQKYIKK